MGYPCAGADATRTASHLFSPGFQPGRVVWRVVWERNDTACLHSSSRSLVVIVRETMSHTNQYVGGGWGVAPRSLDWRSGPFGARCWTAGPARHVSAPDCSWALTAQAWTYFYSSEKCTSPKSATEGHRGRGVGDDAEFERRNHIFEALPK